MVSSGGEDNRMKGSEEWNPRVSIIIPVYNGSNYLREAIDSALAQTYRNTEVIVINDGSTDGGKTEEIALAYGEKIRYFRKENGGVASALNMGIREMTGEYFSWLSHDDLYYPEKLQLQIDWLAHGPRNVILFSDYDFIDAEAKPISTKRLRHTEPGTIFYALIIEGAINGCTVLVPGSCFAEMGVFNENLRTTQDFELWFRLAKKYEFRHLAQPLIKSRIHPEQGSVTLPQHLEEQNQLYINALKNLPSDTSLLDLKGTLTSFYVKAAIRFTSMNCRKAADFVIDRFWSNFFKDSASQKIENTALFIIYFIMSIVYRSEPLRNLTKRSNRFIQKRIVSLVRR